MTGLDSRKSTVEGIRTVDVRYLYRQGMLRPYWRSELHWRCQSRPSGNIQIESYPEHVLLLYHSRSRGETEWEEIRERVDLVWTPCHFGGERPWFLCPRCGQRRAILYGEDKLFLCRGCYRLAYSSQNEGRLDRLLRRAQKIRRRLGVDESVLEPIIFKRKGMHQRTFDRLRAEAERCEAELFSALWKRIGH